MDDPKNEEQTKDYGKLYERVKFLFSYNKGFLYWKEKSSKTSSVIIGSVAGSINGDGYRIIMIDGKYHKASRLIFLLHHNYLPEFVDHIDTDRENDRINNLRDSSFSENQHNSSLRKDNKSGIKGIGWDSKNKTWRARIGLNGKSIFIGNFKKLLDAKNAINKVRKEIHGEFANHG